MLIFSIKSKNHANVHHFIRTVKLILSVDNAIQRSSRVSSLITQATKEVHEKFCYCLYICASFLIYCNEASVDKLELIREKENEFKNNKNDAGCKYFFYVSCVILLINFSENWNICQNHA